LLSMLISFACFHLEAQDNAVHLTSILSLFPHIIVVFCTFVRSFIPFP